MSKRLFFFVAVMFSVVTMMAQPAPQIPKQFTFQALVRDNTGRLIGNSDVNVKINIIQGSETGNPVFYEMQTVHTNVNGLITLNIGGGNSSIENIDWSAGPYFLKVEVDWRMTGDYTLSLVQQIMSVPYALWSERAHIADSVIGGIMEEDPLFTEWDKDYNDLINTPDSISYFVNDAGYLTAADLDIPDSVSAFVNDAGYITAADVPTIPTNVSAFTNDAGYITAADVPTIPTNVSAFTNDAGYITATDVPAIPTNVSAFTNDAGYITASDVPAIPTNVSSFTNDAGYITASDVPAIPTNVSAFTNDVGYLTSYTETQTLADVAALSNAVGAQIKNLYDPTDPMDAVNLRTLDELRDRVEDLEEYVYTTYGDTVVVKCNRFTWYGTTYYESGDYRHVFPHANARGYDSILVLHLTINVGTRNAETQDVCDTYLWHNIPRTATGTYTYNYYDAVGGCPSTDTLHLTVRHSSTFTDVYSVCDEFTWTDGTTYTASNNTAIQTLQNAEGCDSVLHLDLTVSASTHNSETHVELQSYTWHGNTYTESGTMTYLYDNGACPSADTLHLTITHGALTGVFSVSASMKVRFSQGNLQYTTNGTHNTEYSNDAPGTWRFAAQQYNFIGADNANTSPTYSGWIDLFCWGTSGWESGANEYMPYATSTDNNDYHVGGSFTNRLIGDFADADWGYYNSISNGGEVSNRWRTLNRDEWGYLLSVRNASQLNGTYNARYAKATVAGVKGIIVFPDQYTHPTSVALPTSINVRSAAFNSNSYNAEEWAELQNAGVVFLPAAGYRNGSTVEYNGEGGFYWSTTAGTSDYAFGMAIYNNDLGTADSFNRGRARSVRLVENVNQ